METKPGKKTSELWVVIAAAAVLVLMLTGVIPKDEQGYGWAVGALAAAYTGARTAIKAVEMIMARMKGGA